MKKSELRNIIRESIKEVIQEKQLLTEEIHCQEGTAGSSCGGGQHIWCDVVGNHGGFGAGCFCRMPEWCDQYGSNPGCGQIRYQDDETGDMAATRDTSIPATLGSDLSSDMMMREDTCSDTLFSIEKPEAECWKCMPHVRRGGGCQLQQRVNGKCNGGWRSASKCIRKCAKRYDDSIIEPTVDQFR